MSAARLRAVAPGPTLAAAFAAALAVAPAALAQEESEAGSGADAITEISDVVFAVTEEQELKLDLYLPARVGRPPLLVWVHGGAWQRGARKPVSTMAFVENGYAMASVDYRLSPVAAFPAQAHDIKAAIRYLRANADRYGYDATRIGLLGVSAGAHLAALVGTSNGDERLEGEVGEHLGVSSDVQAIVSYFGASNLTSILEQSTPRGLALRRPSLELLLGGALEENEELARLASPVFHVDRRDPPLLLLHGDQDTQMPINQSHELHAAYKRSNGLRVRFSVVHGAGHGGEAFFDRRRTRMVDAFLDKYVRGTY